MFEFIMGERPAKSGFLPAFDKGPDLQFRFRGLRVTMPYKRPFSREGIIGKAITQAEVDGADLSAIAISVSRLFNAGDADEIPTVENPQAGSDLL